MRSGLVNTDSSARTDGPTSSLMTSGACQPWSSSTLHKKQAVSRVLKVSLGTLGGIEAVMVLTFRFLGYSATLNPEASLASSKRTSSEPANPKPKR